MYRRSLAARVTALVLCCLAGAGGTVHADDALARTVSERDFSVAAHLPPGAPLIVGFTRASNDQTRPWRERFDARDGAPPVYLALVLASAPRWVRGMAVRGIRGTMPEDRHDSVLIVTEGEDAWRALVVFEATAKDSAYVVRLDATGQTCFRHVGAITDAAFEASLNADCAVATPDAGDGPPPCSP